MHSAVTFESYLKHAGEKFLRFPWENTTAYSHWLAQTYYFVRNSTRLLTLASGFARPDQNDLHLRFIQHASEEKSHDKLLISDLKHLNLSINDRPEFPQTAAFYQCQYFWIQHVNSASFMGYIYILEGLAMTCGPQAYSRVVKAHGKKAGSFLMVHAQEDIEHLRKAEAEIKKLSGLEKQSFMANLDVSAGLYEQILEGCMAKASLTKAA